MTSGLFKASSTGFLINDKLANSDINKIYQYVSFLLNINK